MDLALSSSNFRDFCIWNIRSPPLTYSITKNNLVCTTVRKGHEQERKVRTGKERNINKGSHFMTHCYLLLLSLSLSLSSPVSVFSLPLSFLLSTHTHIPQLVYYVRQCSMTTLSSKHGNLISRHIWITATRVYTKSMPTALLPSATFGPSQISERRP